MLPGLLPATIFPSFFFYSSFGQGMISHHAASKHQRPICGQMPVQLAHCATGMFVEWNRCCQVSVLQGFANNQSAAAGNEKMCVPVGTQRHGCVQSRSQHQLPCLQSAWGWLSARGQENCVPTSTCCELVSEFWHICTLSASLLIDACYMLIHEKCFLKYPSAVLPTVAL